MSESIINAPDEVQELLGHTARELLIYRELVRELGRRVVRYQTHRAVANEALDKLGQNQEVEDYFGGKATLKIYADLAGALQAEAQELRP